MHQPPATSSTLQHYDLIMIQQTLLPRVAAYLQHSLAVPSICYYVCAVVFFCKQHQVCDQKVIPRRSFVCVRANR